MSDHTLQFVAPGDFKTRARAALDDPALRKSFRGAMDFLQGKRATQFPDDDELQQLRDLGEAVRQRALAQLPALLERLETKLTEAGVHVHWAETAADANAIVLGIAQAKKARRVIKGKSMASEEIELNHSLAEHGVDCIESDMGEFIVQLAGEKPSHIVMPAIHKTRGDIAELFEEHIPGTRYTEDVDELIQTGRRALRRAFTEADILNLLAEPGIVRSRAKIEATIAGARLFNAMGAEAFGAFCWSFTGGEPIRGDAKASVTPLSEKVSKELKRRGFKFVGPTIVHAWMQAVGIVDDHAPGCFRCSAA